MSGIRANKDQCGEYVRRSLAVVTALAPVIRYDRSAEIAKEALKTNRNIWEVAEQMTDLTPDQLTTLLDPRKMANLDRSSESLGDDSAV